MSNEQDKIDDISKAADAVTVAYGKSATERAFFEKLHDISCGEIHDWEPADLIVTASFYADDEDIFNRLLKTAYEDDGDGCTLWLGHLIAEEADVQRDQDVRFLLHAAAVAAGWNDSGAFVAVRLLQLIGEKAGAFHFAQNVIDGLKRAAELAAKACGDDSTQAYAAVQQAMRKWSTAAAFEARKRVAKARQEAGKEASDRTFKGEQLENFGEEEWPSAGDITPKPKPRDVSKRWIIVCDELKKQVRDKTIKGRASAGAQMRAEYASLGSPIELCGGTNPDDFERTLMSEMPWMEAVIRQDVADLRRLRAAGAVHDGFRPRLLVGPAACGKTEYLLRRAEICALPHLLRGPSSDDRDLAGTSSGWGNAMPSLPVRRMHESMAANPCITIDELDKIDTMERRNGNVLDALLGMLEPRTAKSFYDQALCCPVDISRISWGFTANDLQGVASHFRSRVQIVHVERPRVEHVPLIARSMSRRIAEEHGMRPEMMSVAEDAMPVLLKHFKENGGSLRSLRRAVEVFCMMPDAMPN